MAVYTKVEEKNLKEFLKGYDLGELESFEGIEQGVENTNYHLFTTKGHYILTLFEKRVNEKDLPFFFAFSSHLSKGGILCPEAINGKDGEYIKKLCGRPATIITFMDGNGITTKDITEDMCAKLGRTLAQMHKLSLSFPLSRKNSAGFSMWEELVHKVGNKAENIEPGLENILLGELDFIKNNWPANLPAGAVHADIFPDNVFFKNGRLSGIIDFYFTCTDYFCYELAITVNAWCFDENYNLVPKKYNALMKAYEEVRPLEKEEIEALPVIYRAASMRFIASRLYDLVFHPPGAVVKPKDPREYISKLRFHQNGGLEKNGVAA